MATEWQVTRAGRVCRQCERTFEVGEVFRAVLYETRAGYEREDYCQQCSPPADREPVGTWQAQRAAPTTAKTPSFDREAIYSFFMRLEDEDQPEKVQFRFLLALLLWRKKVLKFRETAEANGRECWVFSVTGGDQTYRVVRPELDEAQLEELSSQLEQVLAGGVVDLESPAAATPEESVDG
ncbi:MAG: hypothetical protein PVJ57_10435 [Phycisphaerae bacterium]